MEIARDLYDSCKIYYRMGSSGEKLVEHRYFVIQHGPYSKSSPIDPNINVDRYKKVLIICKKDDIDLCNNLRKDLVNGLPKQTIFKPFNQIFKTTLDFQVVEYESSNYNEDKNEDKILEVYEKNYEQFTFPLVVTPNVAKSQIDSIYYRVKAQFLDETLEEKATPSQVFTKDLLKQRNESNLNTNYNWSLLPTAMQMFTKMGGVPYVLKQSCINVGDRFNVHFMGLGLTIDPKDRQKRVGFVTIFNDNGSLSFMDSNILADNVSESYGKLVSNAIERIIYSSNVNRNILIVHYAGKELRREDDELIRNAIEYALNKEKAIEVYAAKVNRSDIFLIDTDSPSKDKSGGAAYYPRVGNVIRLKDHLYVMTTGGVIAENGKTNILTGGLPSALLISIHRELSNHPSNTNTLSDDDLVNSVFIMSRISYSNLSNPVLSEPITIKYSREIAYLTLRLSYLNERINLPEHIKKVMWFI
jgi:hypothetical protein